MDILGSNNLDGVLGIINTNGVKEDTSTTRISFTELNMRIAQLYALRSADPVRKIGAVIVDDDNHIVGAGYNGMPYVIEGLDNDEVYPWNKYSEDDSDNKYPYVVHAELNAILNAKGSVKGCTLYVTYNCCNECCKAIVQSGIKKVIYMNKKDKDIYNIGRMILRNAGIEVIEYKSDEE